jgi:hypothetical protein
MLATPTQSNAAQFSDERGSASESAANKTISSAVGSGEVVLGEGVSLNGTVIPIELVSYQSGRIEIREHTFINYGSSIAALTSAPVAIYGTTCS